MLLKLKHHHFNFIQTGVCGNFESCVKRNEIRAICRRASGWRRGRIAISFFPFVVRSFLLVNVGVLIEGNIIFIIIWTSGLRSVVSVPEKVVAVRVLSCKWTLTLIGLGSLCIRKARVVLRVRIAVCSMIIIRNWRPKLLSCEVLPLLTLRFWLRDLGTRPRRWCRGRNLSWLFLRFCRLRNSLQVFLRWNFDPHSKQQESLAWVQTKVLPLKSNTSGALMFVSLFLTGRKTFSLSAEDLKAMYTTLPSWYESVSPFLEYSTSWHRSFSKYEKGHMLWCP